jgi:glycosyltransferase involved in cell wall biosynthesis
LREKISVVVPVYNEEDVITEFHRQITAVMKHMQFHYEIIYVDDGSKDNSVFILSKIRDQDPCVGILHLSRNFGKEIALSAGLDHATGDAVIVIDADLQDPPELIPEFIHWWHAGYDVVYGKRVVRIGESWVKKTTATWFYRILRFVSDVDIPTDVGDFRLISRRALNALKTLRERRRYMKGLFAWIGFPQKAVLYRREPRADGCTKWNYWRLWNFAIEGITSFSDTPLKLSTYLGLLTASTAFMYALYIMIRTWLFGNPVPGYPSLIVIMLFLGGVQLICLGIIGEYLARTYNESKGRALYFIQEFCPSALQKEHGDEVMSTVHSQPK